MTEANAPWLYAKAKDPKRVIAALELIATIITIKLWVNSESDRAEIMAQAFTDNKGNSFIVKKELSTKFPITLLVIELAETLRSKDSFTILAWVPRERNTLADALTNLDFEAFDLGLRESVCEDGLRRLVMDDLMESSKVLFDEIKAHKQNKKSGVKTGSKKTQKFFTKWTS